MLLKQTSTPHLIQHKSSHLYNNHQHIYAGSLALILSKRSMMLKLKDNMGEEDDCFTQLSLAVGPQKVSAVSGLDANDKRKQELQLCLWHSPDLNKAGEDHQDHQDLDKCLNNVNVSRKKLRLTREQTHSLENSFEEHTTLSQIQKEELAARLTLLPRQVEVWFQNRRARTKIKQTEVDCEFLKRCCQSLINENRRLKRELQELRRALNVPAPMSPRLALCFRRAPAERSTLAVCPSGDEVAVPSSMAMNESMTSEDEKPKIAL